MKERLTMREWAAEKLPGLPTTERGMLEFAKRSGWPEQGDHWCDGSGRGGASCSYQLLPALAQLAYKQKHMTVGAPAPGEIAVSTGSLSAPAALARDAKLAVVAAYESFCRGSPLSFASRLQTFVDKFNAGSIEVADWVRAEVANVSKRSLLRWQERKRGGNIAALGVDRSKARAGTGVLETANGGALRTFVIALIAFQPKLSGEQVREQCRGQFGETLNVVSSGVQRAVPMPPVRTFQHTLAAWKERHKSELLKLTNPDLWRSTMAPSGTGTQRHVTEANQLWMIDASPTDALCTDGRHAIYACIDIATRNTIWLMSKTPRASAVAMLIRKAVLAWGAPDAVKTDNGSDFVAHETQRLFVALDIEWIRSNSYSPQEKGHVERAIGTMQRDCITLMPGFIGHSVADRKAIEGRKAFAQRLGESDAKLYNVSLSAAEMQGYVDDWASVRYANRPHDGLNGMTPAMAAAQSRRPRRIVDERALDILVMPAPDNNGQRIVRKQGVSIAGHDYQTAVMIGTPVFVRQDPLDLGRALLFEQDGGVYLGEAVCPELSGVDPVKHTAAFKAVQRNLIDERMRDVKVEMRALRKGKPLIERALEVAKGDLPNVTPFPARKIERTTPQIAAALEVAAPAPVVADKHLDDARRQLVEQLQREEEEASARRVDTMVRERLDEIEAERLTRFAAPEVVVLPETPKERYRRAVAAMAAAERGELSGIDGMWLGRYRDSDEYEGQRDMHEQFGDAYLTG